MISCCVQVTVMMPLMLARVKTLRLAGTLTSTTDSVWPSTMVAVLETSITSAVMRIVMPSVLKVTLWGTEFGTIM